MTHGDCLPASGSVEPATGIRGCTATDDLVAELLADAQTWFVVGLSTNRARAAYGVAEFLQRQGRTIVPIHPKAEDVLGSRGFATVEQAAALLGPRTWWIASSAVNSSDRSSTRPSPSGRVRCGCSSTSSTRRRPRGPGWRGLDVVMDRCPARGLAAVGPGGRDAHGCGVMHDLA